MSTAFTLVNTALLFDDFYLCMYILHSVDQKDQIAVRNLSTMQELKIGTQVMNRQIIEKKQRGNICCYTNKATDQG